MDERSRPSRREFLDAALAVPAVLAWGPAAAASSRALAPTPACGPDTRRTPPQTAGPYFRPGSPLRASLVEPGMPGTRLVVEGAVLGADCRPVPRTLLDFWQADADGQYDNAGYRLRGHQLTDEAGRYRLETIVPGQYPGRTRHIHVRVEAPGRPPLTTQLYFPDEAANARDGIFRPELVMAVEAAGEGRRARFDFVLAKQ
jgi:protocatechuate 3,4-dioxygenase beta subunit